MEILTKSVSNDGTMITWREIVRKDFHFTRNLQKNRIFIVDKKTKMKTQNNEIKKIKKQFN